MNQDSPRTSYEDRSVRHPQQPVVQVDGIDRYLQNDIIAWLFDTGKIDLNAISTMGFKTADQCQLAQLLGYSLSGYGDLHYTKEDNAT